jgi:hypothetical protein
MKKMSILFESILFLCCSNSSSRKHRYLNQRNLTRVLTVFQVYSICFFLVVGGLFLQEDETKFVTAKQEESRKQELV